jgi:hypothetical protein
MLEENNCVENPQVAPNRVTISEADILRVQHSTIRAEGQEHHFEPETKKDESNKMTTIRISYNTREKLEALKIDRESYESVIQRLIERSAAKACCPARWM